MEGEYYKVEKILKYKIKNGKRFYFIKWKNFPPSDNSWEPEENLTVDLVAEYHRRQAENKKSSQTKRSASSSQQNQHRRRIVSSTSSHGEVNNHFIANSIERYLTPSPTEEELASFLAIYNGKVAREVKGAARLQMQLFHKVSFKDTEQDELIPAKFTNHLWPSLVIDFYQRHSKLCNS